MSSKEGSTREKKGSAANDQEKRRQKVPLLPLRDVIIFPHMVVPLFVGREKSINALEECVSKKLDLFLVAQKQATTVNPGEKDIFSVGTLGTILQILRLPDNTVKVLIEGKRRARIVEYQETERMIEAEIEEIADQVESTVQSDAAAIFSYRITAGFAWRKNLSGFATSVRGDIAHVGGGVLKMTKS